MSLVAFSLMGAGALTYLSRTNQLERKRHRARNVDRNNEEAVEAAITAGNVGDMAQLANMISHPGYVVGQKYETDLYGVPYRWLLLRNGCAYRTYDCDTQYF